MGTVLNWTINSTFEFLIVALFASTISLVLAAAISKICSRCSAELRFLVWRGGVLLALSLPLAICLMPKVPLGWTLAEIDNTMRQSEFQSGDHPISPNASGFEPGNVTTNEMLQTVPFDWNSMPLVTEGANVTVQQQAAPIAITATNSEYFEILKYMVVLSWLVVAAIRLVLLIYAVWKVHQWRVRSKPLPNGVADHKVRYSADIEVPMTIGGLHPLILLPASAKSWSGQRLKMVLDHEQAHVSRRDVLWNLVTSMSKAILWFQPLLWLAQKQMVLMSEQACDDQVILRGTHPKFYASELVELASEWSSGRQYLFASANSISGPPIRTRVQAILNDSANRKPVAKMTRTTCWISLLVILVSLATIRPFSSTAQANVDTIHLATATDDIVDKSLPLKSEAKQASDVRQLPTSLYGQITDEHEEPVANATVRLLQMRKIPFDSIRLKVAQEWTAKTNGSGEFRFEIQEEHRELTADTTFSANVEADGFVRRVLQLKSNQLKETGEIGKHEIQRGRRVTGRLVEPSEAGYRPPQ